MCYIEHMATVTEHVDDYNGRGPWVLDPSSTLTPDGYLVEAAPGGGNYIRQSTGKPGAAQQLAWYVNTATGSNTNDGATSGTALASMNELILRLAQQPITGAVVLSVVGNDTLFFDFSPNIQGTGSFTVRGTRTVVNEPGKTYTVQRLALWDGATRTTGAYQLTDQLAGHPDLSALGWSGGLAFVRNKPGPLGQQIIAAIGNDLGSGTFNGAWLRFDTPVSVEPSEGEPVDVYTCNAIGFLYVNVSSFGPSGTGAIFFEDIFIYGMVVNGSGALTFKGCQIGNPDVNVIGPGTGSVVLYGCAIGIGNPVLVQGGNLTLVSTFVPTRLVANLYGSTSVQGYALFYEGGITIGASDRAGAISSVPATFVITQDGIVSIVDYDQGVGADASALSLVRGNVDVQGYLFCSTIGAPPQGFVVRPGGMLTYAPGQIPVVGANNPTSPWVVAGTPYSQVALEAAVPLTAKGAFVVEDA